MRGDAHTLTQAERAHCAGSMLSVLESLWKARTALAKLQSRRHGPALRDEQILDWVLPGNVREQGDLACLKWAIRKTERHHGIRRP